jgi:hypothetical protein
MDSEEGGEVVCFSVTSVPVKKIQVSPEEEREGVTSKQL